MNKSYTIYHTSIACVCYFQARVKFVVHSSKYTLYVYQHKGRGQRHKMNEMQ